jgi:hypothetical protein
LPGSDREAGESADVERSEQLPEVFGGNLRNNRLRIYGF